jgi:hypothetical protein
MGDATFLEEADEAAEFVESTGFIAEAALVVREVAFILGSPVQVGLLVERLSSSARPWLDAKMETMMMATQGGREDAFIGKKN